MLAAHDIYLFREGTHGRLYECLGCALGQEDGRAGARFAVWAPNARSVAVIADCNAWNPETDPLQARDDGSGIWQGFVPGVKRGQAYKYRIVSRHGGYRVDKADPFGLYAEVPPATASRAWTLDYEWHDAPWMAARQAKNAVDAPIAIYEVHLGSWRRSEGNRLPTYSEIAFPLAEYAGKLGFTHVELLPIT